MTCAASAHRAHLWNYASCHPCGPIVPMMRSANRRPPSSHPINAYRFLTVVFHVGAKLLPWSLLICLSLGQAVGLLDALIARQSLRVIRRHFHWQSSLWEGRDDVCWSRFDICRYSCVRSACYRWLVKPFRFTRRIYRIYVHFFISIQKFKLSHGIVYVRVEYNINAPCAFVIIMSFIYT